MKPAGGHRWVIAWLLGVGVLVNYFGPGEPVGLACGTLRDLRDFKCHLRLSFRCVQLDLRGVSAAGRRAARPVRRAQGGAAQHAALGPGIVRRRHHAKHRRLLWRKASAWRGRGADVPGKCQGDRVVVSSRRAQLRHVHLRCRGEVRIGHRRSNHRRAAAEGGLALELCRDRPRQPALLRALQPAVPRPGGEPAAVSRGTRLHRDGKPQCRWDAAAGRAGVAQLPAGKEEGAWGLRSDWDRTTTSSTCCSRGCRRILRPRCISTCCNRFCTPACPGWLPRCAISPPGSVPMR